MGSFAFVTFLGGAFPNPPPAGFFLLGDFACRDVVDGKYGERDTNAN